MEGEPKKRSKSKPATLGPGVFKIQDFWTQEVSLCLVKTIL